MNKYYFTITFDGTVNCNDFVTKELLSKCVNKFDQRGGDDFGTTFIINNVLFYLNIFWNSDGCYLPFEARINLAHIDLNGYIDVIDDDSEMMCPVYFETGFDVDTKYDAKCLEYITI